MPNANVMRHSPQLSRPKLIEQHISAYLRETGTSQQSFAANVVEQYHATVPEAQRCIEFSTRDDVFERTKRDAEKVMRYLDGGSCRLPVEIEDALILALPDDRRCALLYALNQRLGCITVGIGQASNDAITPETVMKEIGEGLIAMSGSDVNAQIKELREAAAAANAMADDLENKKAAVGQRLQHAHGNAR
ncbi:hypothetical protein KRX19_05705 [Cardiobacteriaceae bacterium TAE3-ERU3]|nr:hypothetical protein [Cardiobacteriaceae bacterium TAE3-ERU3]